MAYQVGGRVQASDFNALANTLLNPGWSTGTGSLGYGQPGFPVVQINDTISAAPATVVAGSPPTWSATPQWRALVDSVNRMSQHQVGTTAVPANSFTGSGVYPATSGKIAYSTALQTAISTVCGNQRFSALAQGTPTVQAFVNSLGTWSDYLVCNIEINFSNLNRARYFFNAGGQFRLSMSHSGSSAIDAAFAAIATAFGSMYLSSTNATSMTIVGQQFSGVTKIGGGNLSSTTVNNLGFYQLTSSLVEIYRQTGTDNSHNISVSASHNGAGLITLQVIWNQQPDVFKVSTGSTITLGVIPPSTAILADTWGVPTVTNSIAVFQGADCPTPVVNTISPAEFGAGLQYTGSITISNSTVSPTPPVVVSGLPTGVTVGSPISQSGTSVVIPITGTPEVKNQAWGPILVNAENTGICVAVSVTNQSAGSGTVAATPCPTPVFSNFTQNMAPKALQAYSGSIQVSNPSTTTLALSEGPIWLTPGTYNSSTGVLPFSGTPPADTGGNQFYLKFTATNTCGNPKDPTTLVSEKYGETTIVTADVCPVTTEVTVPSNNPLFKPYQAYSGTITVNNATSVTSVTGLPDGITYTQAQSGTSVVLTLSATSVNSPAGTSHEIYIASTNACGLAGYVTSTQAATKWLTIIMAANDACADPTIGDLSNSTFKANQSYSGSITVSGATSASITGGLPTGVSAGTPTVSGSTITIPLSGTVSAAAGAQFTIAVSATNNCGTPGFDATTRTRNIAVTVTAQDQCAAPTITDINLPNSTVGTSYAGSFKVNNVVSADDVSVTISGTNQNWASATKSYLSGIVTVSISGTVPLAASGNTYTVTVTTATNNCGGGAAPASITNVTVGTFLISNANTCAAPTASTTFTAGIPGVVYSHPFTIQNVTSDVTILGLPTGLSVETLTYSGGNASVSIYGTVDSSVTPGSYPITFNAVNAGNGTCAPANVSGISIGSLPITAAGNCATPEYVIYPTAPALKSSMPGTGTTYTMTGEGVVKFTLSVSAGGRIRILGYINNVLLNSGAITNGVFLDDYIASNNIDLVPFENYWIEILAPASTNITPTIGTADPVDFIAMPKTQMAGNSFSGFFALINDTVEGQTIGYEQIISVNIYREKSGYDLLSSGVFTLRLNSTLATGGTGGTGGGGCFVVGTQIAMADGTNKNIEDLVVGDQLASVAIDGLSLAENSWKTWESATFAASEGVATVTAVRIDSFREFYSINNGLLEATFEHPLLVQRGPVYKFLRVLDVQLGDKVYTRSNQWIEVTSKELVQINSSTVNIDVEENDVYFANGILAHNIGDNQNKN
jgi:hypothetical protein